MSFITLTNHERGEFARFSRACVDANHDRVANKLEQASHADALPIATFDNLMARYRAWLNFNQLPANE